MDALKPRYLSMTPETLRALLARRLEIEKGNVFGDISITRDGESHRVMDVYQQAMAQLGSGRPDADEFVERSLRDILQEVPEFSEGHFQLGRIYLLRGQRDLGLQLARNAAAMLPGNKAYELLLITALMMSGSRDEACARAEKFAAIFAVSNVRDQIVDPATFILGKHLNYILPGYVLHDGVLEPSAALCGRILADLARSEDAGQKLGVLRDFIAANPRISEATFWLAEILRRQGNIREALEFCESAPRDLSRDWAFMIEKGVLQWQSGQKLAALSSFEEAALINHSLPIFAPHNLDESSAEMLFGWYRRGLDGLPVKGGLYAANWLRDAPPALKQSISRETRPWKHLRTEATQDFVQTLQRRDAWLLLARNDVAARYRRTALGPWWVVLGSGVALLGMVTVWSLIFNISMNDFFPYLSAGYAIWLLLSSLVVDGCGAFTDGQAATIQKNLDVPRLLHVFRLVTRNFLLFLHTIAIFVVGSVFFGFNFAWTNLLAVPGLVILYLNGLWFVVLLGIVGARFRDFAPAVSAFMTVIFFVTPVLWKVDMLGERAHLAALNPFTHLIAIVREPLLGIAPSATAWTASLGLLFFGTLIASLVFVRVRQRIIFWV